MHSWCVESEKWVEFFFISGHQRKSPFCTFSCINPGFGRPWDMLRKKIFIAIFITLQKNAFGQKKFWISCTGSKVPWNSKIQKLWVYLITILKALNQHFAHLCFARRLLLLTKLKDSQIPSSGNLIIVGGFSCTSPSWLSVTSCGSQCKLVPILELNC